MNKIINTISKKIPVPILVFSVLYLLLIILSRNIPMFWDMSNVSWAGNLIYDSHFTTFIFPNADIDQGAVPLYSTYLALLWVLFGKSLFVSHLAVFPFIVGVLFQLYKLGARFVSSKQVWLVFILLFIEPTIFTQVYLAGIDLVFCFMFLLAVNSAIDNRRILLMFSILLMPILRLRGFTFVVSVALIDWYLNKENFQNLFAFIKSRFLIYLAPLFVFLAWYILHYSHSGWLIISDNRKDFHQWTGLGGMLRNLVYVIWKILDFGRIFLFAPLILLLSYKRQGDMKSKQLLMILLFSLLPYLIFFLPLKYPVSHRHFMILFIIGIIAFVFIAGKLGKVPKKIIYFFVIVGLITGNFWLYPERYGNGWDASMKVAPYFKLKDNLDVYIKDTGIDNNDVATKFPMDFDVYNSNLAEDKFSYEYINGEPLENFSFILQSNVCNTFTPEEIEELRNEWGLVKEFSSWPVYIRLYKNPDIPELKIK